MSVNPMPYVISSCGVTAYPLRFLQTGRLLRYSPSCGMSVTHVEIKVEKLEQEKLVLLQEQASLQTHLRQSHPAHPLPNKDGSPSRHHFWQRNCPWPHSFGLAASCWGARRIREKSYAKAKSVLDYPRRDCGVLSPLAATQSAGKRRSPSVYGRRTQAGTARSPCVSGPPVFHAHP